MRGIGLLVIATACDTSIRQHPLGPDAALTAECVEAESKSDLPWIEDHVFYHSCSQFMSCHHSGAGPAEKLDLSTGNAYASLVGRPSQESPGWLRVTPGDPDHSYLLVKMGQIHGPLGDAGTTMPPQNQLVCGPKRAAVERWIAAGAPSGLPDGGVVVDGAPQD